MNYNMEEFTETAQYALKFYEEKKSMIPEEVTDDNFDIIRSLITDMVNNAPTPTPELNEAYIKLLKEIFEASVLNCRHQLFTLLRNIIGISSEEDDFLFVTAYNRLLDGLYGGFPYGDFKTSLQTINYKRRIHALSRSDILTLLFFGTYPASIKTYDKNLEILDLIYETIARKDSTIEEAKNNYVFEKDMTIQQDLSAIELNHLILLTTDFANRDYYKAIEITDSELEGEISYTDTSDIETPKTIDIPPVPDDGPISEEDQLPDPSAETGEDI